MKNKLSPPSSSSESGFAGVRLAFGFGLLTATEVLFGLAADAALLPLGLAFLFGLAAAGLRLAFQS